MQQRHVWWGIGTAAMAMAALAACASGPESSDRSDPGPALLAGAAPKIIGPCPEYACGENSPTIDSMGFHELNLFAAPNAQGFAIQSSKGRAQIVDSAGISWDLTVVDGRLIGSHGGGICPGRTCTLTGPALVGARIPIVLGTKSYDLTITSVRQTGYFLEPGTTEPAIESYKMKWGISSGAALPADLSDAVSLCSDFNSVEPTFSTGQMAPELMGLQLDEVVVFEGDRFDSSTRTVQKAADDSWFNLSCAGATLAKLRLTHNTVHTLGALPTWEERQATLKMFSADYCGTGESFTVPGQTLAWQGGAMKGYYNDEPIASFEARWGANGATCLSDPRISHPSTDLGKQLQKQFLDELAKACSLPVCPDVDPPDQFDGALRITANPGLGI